MAVAGRISVQSMLELAAAEYNLANATITQYRCALEAREWQRAEQLRAKALHHLGECMDHFAVAYKEMARPPCSG